MREVVNRRRVLNMSQEELAHKAHVSLRDVQLIERYSLVDVAVARKVCRVLAREEKATLDEAWRRVHEARHYLETS